MFSKPFIKKAVLIVGVSLLLIFGLVTLFSIDIKKKLVSHFNESQSDFVLEIGQFHTSIFLGKVSLKNVHLRNVQKRINSALRTFDADMITIENVSLYKLFVRKELNAGVLKVNAPKIVMQGVPAKESESQNWKNKLKIFIKDIRIVDPVFNYCKNERDTTVLFQTKKGLITISEFKLDTLENEDKFSAGNVYGEIGNIVYRTMDSLYTVSCKKLSLSYRDSLFEMDSLVIAPNFKKKDFGWKVGRQVDCVAMVIQKVKSTTFDTKKWSEQQAFECDSLQIEGLKIDVYRDKNLKAMLSLATTVQQHVKGIDFPLDIRYCEIRDGNVAYEELNPHAKKAGKITFEKMNAMFFGITNSVTTDTMKADITCLLAGNSKFHSQFLFPMIAGDSTFKCSGVLSRFQLPALNMILPYNTGYKVVDGVVDAFDFSFWGSSKNARGSMRLKYHDLKIAAVDESYSPKGGGLKLKSFIANKFILRKEVPSKRKPNYAATIYLKRDPNRFIFSFGWDALSAAMNKIATGTN
jgi:hypothetical protein